MTKEQLYVNENKFVLWASGAKVNEAYCEENAKQTYFESRSHMGVAFASNPSRLRRPLREKQLIVSASRVFCSVTYNAAKRMWSRLPGSIFVAEEYRKLRRARKTWNSSRKVSKLCRACRYRVMFTLLWFLQVAKKKSLWTGEACTSIVWYLVSFTFWFRER